METLRLQRECDLNAKWSSWSIRLALEYSGDDTLAEHYVWLSAKYAAKAAHYARLYLNSTFGR